MDIDTDALGRKALTDLLTTAGYKSGQVSKMVNGKITPRLDVLLEMEELTGIPVALWGNSNRGAAMWARIKDGK